jgi:hypothetical protein
MLSITVSFDADCSDMVLYIYAHYTYMQYTYVVTWMMGVKKVNGEIMQLQNLMKSYDLLTILLDEFLYRFLLFRKRSMK